MGEVLIECCLCGMEMKYSHFKVHICSGHRIAGLEELMELIDEMINEDKLES